MPRPRYDNKARAFDTAGHFLSERWGRKLIVITDHHGRGASDAGKIRTGVGARHICVEMTNECLCATFRCHCVVTPKQRFIITAAGMHDQSELEIKALAEPSRLRHGNAFSP